VADVDFMLRLMSEHQDNPPEPTSDMVAKRELAVQLRRLNNLLCATQAPEDHIRELAGILEGHASLLEDALPEPEALGEDVKVISPQMEDFTDRSPFVGLANPISPPATLRFDLDDRCVRGEVTFRKSMEGAPGRVHGGMVAALLDEALGQACIFAGTPAMTAEFTARFLKATPVETPLRVEARVDGVDGRKIRASGAVFHGDESVVEADGLFIAVDTEKFQALFALLAETEQ
jgi:acyl-coenzyme A thioesterase PaaI-like protein